MLFLVRLASTLSAINLLVLCPMEPSPFMKLIVLSIVKILLFWYVYRHHLLIRNECRIRHETADFLGKVLLLLSKVRKSTFDSFAIKNADPQAGFALLAGVAIRLSSLDKAPFCELMSRVYATYYLPATAPIQNSTYPLMKTIHHIMQNYFLCYHSRLSP